MLFLGYWSLWFLFWFFVMFTGKLKIVDNQIFTLLVFSLILAIPSWFIHLAFLVIRGASCQN